MYYGLGTASEVFLIFNTHLYHTDQSPQGHGQYAGQGEYCGLSTASEVFLIFTTQLYRYFSVMFLFALVSDKPEVFLPKYSQTAIPQAAHFRRVVNYEFTL